MIDSTLREIRQTRDAFSKQYHGDITAMLADLHDSHASQVNSYRTTCSIPELRVMQPMSG